jgi:TolB-like protein/DNA-binding winged helix-turn-helix (wHTH) protein/Tfp pilus assembly protein PilF
VSDSTAPRGGGHTAVLLPDQFYLADLHVDLGLQSVRRDTVDIPLPKLSFDVLLALARAAPNIISIDELMSQVWQGLVVNPETVSQRIKLLRDALGDDPQAPRYITSMRGRGYRLLPAVIPIIPSENSAASVVEPPPVTTTSGAPASEPYVSQRRPSRRVIVIAIAAVVVVAGAAILWRQFFASEKSAASHAKPTAVTVSGIQPRTVAVLPFADLSIQGDNGRLAQAVPEMVLQRLGTVKELIVIARSSSFSFIGQQIDTREIGRRLDARYLVEGSLQRVDDRLRVTAQLVDAHTGVQLRSLRFDRRIGEIFELQDDIAAQLAATLQVQLLGADMHRVDRSRDTSLDAYLSYLDAQSLLNRWTVKDAEQAIVDLEHAIKLDPTFALAYAELARARHLYNYLRTGFEGTDRSDLLPLLDKALALDPRLGEAYAMRGSLQTDFKAADADFRKGIELAPNYGPGYQMYAEALWEEPGRAQDAKAMIEQAIAIDPIASRNYYIKARILGDTEGHWDQAEEYFAKALALGPEFPPAIARLAELTWSRGQTAEGIKLIERALRAESNAPWLRILACAMYLDVDDRQAAGSVAEGMPSNSDTSVMLAAYDRDYRTAANHQGEFIYQMGPTEYSYWMAVDSVAIDSGTIDQTIALLRERLSLHEGSTSVSMPGAFDFGAAFVLAHLLKIKGDRAALAPLLPTLEAVADRWEDKPGVMQGLVQLLSGDQEAAIDLFTADFRRNHSNTWWVRLRDPMLVELRKNPRYLAGFQIELDRVAKQRKILEDMRDKGEVPRRSALSAAAPGR